MTSEAPERIAAPSWTPRQRQVLDLLARGYTNGQIGQALGISLDGAKWHVSEVMGKLGVESREGAAAYWREYNGLSARFSRTLRSVLIVPGLRWLAGAAVAAGAGLVAVLAVLSFGGDDDNQQAAPETATATPTAIATSTPRPTPTPTTTPTLRTYPADTRTNIPAVDAVIDAVLAGDVTRIESLMYWAPVECGGEQLRIACEDGEPEGTIVEGFLMGECKGDWKRRAEIGEVLRQMVEGAPALYAVFRADEVPQFLLPPYGHGVVFLAPDHRGRTVRVTDEGIIGLFLGCKPDPREALMKQYNLVLPPLGEP